MKLSPPKLPSPNDTPARQTQPYPEDNARIGRTPSARTHADHNGSKLNLPKGSARRQETLLRDGGLELSADGLFFEQLLAPLEWDGAQQGSGSQSQAFMSAPNDSETADNSASGWSSLMDEIARQMPSGADQFLQVTLFMPTLGRIGLNALHRQPKGWYLELDCAEIETAKRLRQHFPKCQNDLSRALSQPVKLSVRHRGSA